MRCKGRMCDREPVRFFLWTDGVVFGLCGPCWDKSLPPESTSGREVSAEELLVLEVLDS